MVIKEIESKFGEAQRNKLVKLVFKELLTTRIIPRVEGRRSLSLFQ